MSAREIEAGAAPAAAAPARALATKAAPAPTCSCCAAEPAGPSAGQTGSGAASSSARAAAPAASDQGYALRRELLAFGAAILISLGGWLLGREAESGRLALPAWLLPLPFVAAWLVAGWNVILGAARNILKGRVFDELFLMAIATIGALVIGEYEEAVGVMIFYKVGEMLQEGAAARSRASVRALLDLRPDKARLRRGDSWIELPAEEAAPGDLALVLPGERLPLDGEVVEGESLVDTKALTGEPTPRRAAPGSALLAGFIALDGSLTIRATKLAGESSAARIAELVENAAHAKARSERFVTRFARVYTPIVVLAAAALALLPPLLVPGQELATWAYRALVLLVISCPCALVVSVPLGYFGGLGGAARRGILVKGGEALDGLARAGTVVFDKTGTLTKGSFELLSVEPARAGAAPADGAATDDTGAASWNADSLLELAARAESRSRHPVALSIREAARRRGLDEGSDDAAGAVREFPGRGVEAEVGGRRVLLGNAALLAAKAVAPPSDLGPAGGATEVLVAVDGVYAGRLLVGDAPKPDAAAAVAELRGLGASRIAMLTGDAEGPARAVAAELGLDEVHAGLLPEGKLERLARIIEEERASGRAVLFVGDGTNDAPVLARADVGIAMGAGADAAVESADVVLMTDEPSRVPEAVRRARRTRSIVMQNIALVLVLKAGFLALGAAGVAVMWEAVIADVGVALLATANSLRAMR